jgi:hypothetical protein
MTEMRSSIAGMEMRLEKSESISPVAYRELLDRERYFEARSRDEMSDF